MTTSTARQPKGVPVGGQFAATAHSKPSLRLQAPDPEVSPTKPWRPYELTENGDGTFNYNEAGDKTTREHRRPVARTDIRRPSAARAARAVSWT